MPLKKKFEGATARLFAALCEHYTFAAEEQCNDAPDEVPLFSWLSPQQRLSLTKDVMIGALCENEPMFPDTIQHNATYYGLIKVLYTELEVEIDQAAMDDHYDELGEDLLEAGRKQCITPTDNLGSRNRNQSSSRDPEIDFSMERELMEHRAGKNRKKLDKLGNKVGEFEVKPEEPDIGELTSQFMDMMSDVFVGGPMSGIPRERIRPLRGDEPDAFKWRLLCDAALQEDTTGLPFPLSQVNFDFRCQSLLKWSQALNLLLITKCFKVPNPKDHALIYSGEINEYTYADRDKFPLIREIEKHTDILRKVYDMKWNSEKLSYDQRCIYAVTCNSAYCGTGHKKWVTAFLRKCAEQNIDIVRDTKFQKRLKIFYDTVAEIPDGLDMPYHFDFNKETWKPSNFEPDKYDTKVRYCSGPPKKTSLGRGHFFDMPCYETENLQACSRCKVVLYCSKECQKRHWNEHKLQCAKLAAARKDKEQLSKMAKSK